MNTFHIIQTINALIGETTISHNPPVWNKESPITKDKYSATQTITMQKETEGNTG